MEILLNQIGKRFNFNWIFKDISISVGSSEKWVILGPNGSGKSTFLKLLSGAVLPSEGSINWKLGGATIESELIYKYVSISAPYLELIEEFTLAEHIDFHFSIKPSVANISHSKILELTGLKNSANRRISYFSSGMIQRVKLSLAILSDTPLLLLDEPLSNLDAQATSWYQNLIHEYAASKTVIVCSNSQKPEYEYCQKELNIQSYRLL
jgi:ABC-type multidrug transport system ATPase subunit